MVEVMGVGYRVVAAPTTIIGLGEVGDEVFVWVHHRLREDNETLYGFATREERGTFEALLGAHGVGPSLALAILSVHPPPALARILAEDDIGALCLVPGVGKKTATRLLVELKSRLHIPLSGVVPTMSTGGGNGDNPAGGGNGARSARTDVRDALAGLGYSTDEIAAATAELAENGDPATMLREALRRLAQAG